MSPLTCGVCELEGDGFVRDAADVADGHLARVAGVILGPQVFQLQDFGFTLGVGEKRRGWGKTQAYKAQFITASP